MVAPIADVKFQETATEASKARVAWAVGLNEADKQRVRRETAVTLLAAILSGPSGSSGGIDNVTDRALEWTDFLLEKLSR